MPGSSGPTSSATRRAPESLWQQAIDFPEAVRTLALLESARPAKNASAADGAVEPSGYGLVGQELPAVQRWSFTETDAARVTQPVLAVLGAKSAPTFVERRQLLRAWLPNVEQTCPTRRTCSTSSSRA